MTMVKVQVNFPKEVLIKTGRTKEKVALELKQMMALELYRNGELSFGQAARLAEMRHSDFINFLGKHKVSVFNYTSEELEEELQDEPLK